MQDKDWLIGILSRRGRLKTESGKVLLTTLPKEAASARGEPEAAVLPVSEEDLGKTALARGDLAGKVLYSAQVETPPRLTGALIQTLAKKGIVSLTEIKERLSEMGGESAVDGEDLPKKLCALVIGHKKSSVGAVNEKAGITEFDFNEDLAVRIEQKVKKAKVQRIYRRTYKTLPSDINELNPDFTVSLHCNAFNQKATGTEVLYYYKSHKSENMAEVLQRHLVEYLKLPDRGIKPKKSEDRGGYLLRYTIAPCVIAEPFFIDNNKDLARAQEDMDGLAAAYAAGIEEIARIV